MSSVRLLKWSILIGLLLFVLYGEFVHCQVSVLNCPQDICERPDSESQTFKMISRDDPTLQNGTTLSPDFGIIHFEVGGPPTTIQYTFQGMVVCSYTVEVSNSCPSLDGCPGDLEISPDQFFDNDGKVFVQWTEPTPSPGFHPVPTDNTTAPDLPQRFIDFGSSTDFMYSLQDGKGREATCGFSITVLAVDKEPPQTSCPNNITVNASDIWQCTVVNWDEPTAEDGESYWTGRTAAPGDCFLIGVTTVVYDLADPAGNEGVCQFDVIVEDATPPRVSNCPPSPLRYTVPLGDSLAVVSWPEPQAQDNSGMFTVNSNYQPGDTFDVGTTNVTYNYTDEVGNRAVCEFQIIITESSDANPELLVTNCPDPLTVTTTGDGEEINWSIPTTNQDGLGFEYSTHTPRSRFPIGTTRVTYMFFDEVKRNSAVCSFTVTVLDETPPSVMSCPPSLMLSPDSSGMSAQRSWTEPTVSDNSGLVQRIVRTSAPREVFSASGDQDIAYPISYVYIDPSGNTATCEFLLTVLASEPEDTDVTILYCPKLVKANLPEYANKVSASWTEPRLLKSDDVVSWNRSHAPGFLFPLGNTTVTYVFTDVEGEEYTCSFEVMISDVTPPKIENCPLGFNRTSSSAVDRFWMDPTASDNSGEVPILTTPSDEPLQVDEQRVISYQFRDGAGNVAECSFTVSIKASSGNNTTPVIEDCPQNITVDAPQDGNQIEVTWSEPTSSEANASVISNYSPGDMFPIGRSVVTYSFTDDSGRGAICQFVVIVGDVAAPNVTCTGDIVQTVRSRPREPHIYWEEPTSMDNSGFTIRTRSHAPGDIFTAGTTMVSYLFSDTTGNSATCNFTVTVQVNAEPPEFTTCPADLYSVADPTTGDAVASWLVPEAKDDTDRSPVVSGSHSPSDRFPVGTTRVSYESRDAEGNVAEPCTFFVTVRDVTPPEVNDCPDTITATLLYGSTSMTVSWNEPSTPDSMAEINITSSHRPGDVFFVGSTSVEYVFMDQSGNTALCLFPVIVQPVIDREPPVITGCPLDAIQMDAPPTNDRTSVFWSDVNATDALTEVSLTSSHESGSEFSIGQYKVNLHFVDQAGNAADCNFTVIVSDVTPPLVENCPNDVTKIINTGNLSSPVSWTIPQVSDNSGSFTVNDNVPAPGDIFQVRKTVIVYVYSDAANNSETCEITITLIDDSGYPVVRHCPDEGVEKSVRPDSTMAVVRWRTPTGSDPDTNVTVQATHQSGDLFPLGTQEVTYTFEDHSGNQINCTFNVTVTNDLIGTTPQRITFTNCPSEVTANADPDGPCASVTWEEPVNSSDVVILKNQTHSPGDLFCLGETEVLYTFFDFVYEEYSICSFLVTVTDVTSPVIFNCSSGIGTTKDRSDKNFQVNWIIPDAVDNSGDEVVIIQSEGPEPGDIFETGDTMVSYVFRDSSNNQAVCSFTISVDDGTLIFGLTMTEVVVAAVGAVVATLLLLVILLCCCWCCCVCCCKDEDQQDDERQNSEDQMSETESQLDYLDPHHYWVLPNRVRKASRRVSRRVGRSFRSARRRYSDRGSRRNLRSEKKRRELQMGVLNQSFNSFDQVRPAGGTLDRRVVEITSDHEDYDL